MGLNSFKHHKFKSGQPTSAHFRKMTWTSLLKDILGLQRTKLQTLFVTLMLSLNLYWCHFKLLYRSLKSINQKESYLIF